MLYFTQEWIQSKSVSYADDEFAGVLITLDFHGETLLTDEIFIELERLRNEKASAAATQVYSAWGAGPPIDRAAER